MSDTHAPEDAVVGPAATAVVTVETQPALEPDSIEIAVLNMLIGRQSAQMDWAIHRVMRETARFAATMRECGWSPEQRNTLVSPTSHEGGRDDEAQSRASEARDFFRRVTEIAQEFLAADQTAGNLVRTKLALMDDPDFRGGAALRQETVEARARVIEATADSERRLAQRRALWKARVQEGKSQG
jgi:hypothetical protein